MQYYPAALPCNIAMLHFSYVCLAKGEGNVLCTVPFFDFQYQVTNGIKSPALTLNKFCDPIVRYHFGSTIG